MVLSKHLFYIRVDEQMLLMTVMSEEIRYYKGKYKVSILSKSQDSWLIKALEPFEDCVYAETVTVKVGEERFVSPTQLFKKKGYVGPVPEHVYEQNMEKKLKHIVEKEEDKKHLS